ncbi:hypothetical protein SAMN06264348_103123 [Oceanospirillum linum]|nr:hypothetical protein SAMN04489856_102125 [Oleiphilus messinensis]SMP16278.1 hypothetical protein SAMN06264348_103123 [Oceanospirillum linum]
MIPFLREVAGEKERGRKSEIPGSMRVMAQRLWCLSGELSSRVNYDLQMIVDCRVCDRSLKFSKVILSFFGKLRYLAFTQRTCQEN